MQKIIAWLMAAFTAFLGLFGIGNTAKINADKKVLAHFEQYMSVDDVLKDVEKIDLYHKMDTKGLTYKKVEDKDNSTTTIYYYDGEKLVYEQYEGFGEAGFAHYTKSKSGKDVKVNYYDDNDVRIGCSEYSVAFWRLNKKAKYGADNLNITVGKLNNNSPLGEYVNYYYDGSVWTIENCVYLADDGLHKYSAYINVDSGKLQEYDNLLFQKVNSADTSLIKKLIAYFGDTPFIMDLNMGGHKISYIDNGKTQQWYYTGSAIFTFDKYEDAQAFAKEFGVTAEDGLYDEAYSYVSIKVTLAINNSDMDIVTRSLTEIDDSFTINPRLNKDYEIISHSYGTVQYY